MEFDYVGILCMRYLTECVVESVELYSTKKLASHPLVSTDITFPSEFFVPINLLATDFFFKF